MKRILLLLLTFILTNASAQDFKSVDRSIKKEPKYKTKNPRYCLLALEQDLKTPIWMVLDGPELYIDLNRNKDLTDDGEYLKLKQRRTYTKLKSLNDTTEYGFSLALHNYELIRLNFECLSDRVNWTVHSEDYGKFGWSKNRSDAPIVCLGFNQEIDPSGIPEEITLEDSLECKAYIVTKGYRAITVLNRNYSLPDDGIVEFPTATLESVNSPLGNISIKLRERC
ncbi:hypothetical protein KAR48_18180 [bacterium]|nr:hypothetical protein [bacterium]